MARGARFFVAAAVGWRLARVACCRIFKQLLCCKTKLRLGCFCRRTLIVVFVSEMAPISRARAHISNRSFCARPPLISRSANAAAMREVFSTRNTSRRSRARRARASSERKARANDPHATGAERDCCARFLQRARAACADSDRLALKVQDEKKKQSRTRARQPRRRRRRHRRPTAHDDVAGR